jgi:hypothetical protein
MLNEHTLDQLRALRLDGMVRAIEDQATSTAAHELPFDDRLTLLVQSEVAWRDGRRVARLLKAAKLKVSAACIEDINWRTSRGLDRGLITALAGGDARPAQTGPTALAGAPPESPRACGARGSSLRPAPAVPRHQTAWPRAEGAGGVTVDEHLDHHGRVKRLVARAALGVAGVKGAQIQAVNAVADEVRQVALGQPVLQRIEQQSLLLRFVGEVACGHARNLPSPIEFVRLLPRRLLCLKVGQF